MGSDFGIPVTVGHKMVTGASGIVVSFNMRPLNMLGVLGVQLFTQDRQALTPVVAPFLRVTDIFQFPVLSNPPGLALVQEKDRCLVFLRTPPFGYDDKLRLVFWFLRHPKPIGRPEDEMDIPDGTEDLVVAYAARKLLKDKGQPVPQDIEDTIQRETEKYSRDSNAINYYLKDTFVVPRETLKKLESESAIISESVVSQEATKKSKSEKWTKTKSEFAQHIVSQYQSHMNEYTDYKDATFKLFERYVFPFRWSAKKCYELVKKTPK